MTTDELFVEHKELHEKWVKLCASKGSQNPETMAVSSQASDVFRQLVSIDKDDVNRPKNGDAYQNGARL